MIYTTLNRISSHSPSADFWTKLLKNLDKTQADDDPLPLLTVLESNGLDDAIWAIRAIDNPQQLAGKFALQCAKEAQHLMTDRRSIAALNALEQCLNGAATIDEIRDAIYAVRNAVYAVRNVAARTKHFKILKELVK